jgi:hypothetical protein
VRPKRLLDKSPWLQFTSECQRFDPTAPQQVAVLTAVKQMSARARRLGGEAAAERAAAELALREELRCGRVP